MYENITRLREPLIESIIESLDLDPDSKGIDIGCEIGYITNLSSDKLRLKNHLGQTNYLHLK